MTFCPWPKSFLAYGKTVLLLLMFVESFADLHTNLCCIIRLVVKILNSFDVF